MHSFEDVRAHVASHYAIGDSSPYLVSFDLALGEGRRQSMFLAEIAGEDGARYLRLSTPIAPLGRFDAAKCLQFNWAQRVGWFALSEIDGQDFLHLCENRPYRGLSGKELDRVIVEIGTLADRLEHLMNRRKDVA